MFQCAPYGARRTRGMLGASIALVLLLTACSAPSLPVPTAPPESTGAVASVSASTTVSPNQTEKETPKRQVTVATAVREEGSLALSRGFSGTWGAGRCVLSTKSSMVCHTAAVPALSPGEFDRIIPQGALIGTGPEFETVKIQGISGTRVEIKRSLPTAHGFLFEVTDGQSHRLQAVDVRGRELWRHSFASAEPLWDLAVQSDGQILMRDDSGISSLSKDGRTAGTVNARAGAVILGAVSHDNGVISSAGRSVGLSRRDGGEILTPQDVPALGTSCLVTPSADCTDDRLLYADDQVIVIADMNRAADGGAIAFGASGEELWRDEGFGESVVRFKSVLVTASDARSPGGSALRAVNWLDGRTLWTGTHAREGAMWQLIGTTETGVVASERFEGGQGSYELMNAVVGLRVTEAHVDAQPVIEAKPASQSRASSPEGSFTYVLPEGWKAVKGKDALRVPQTLLSWGERISVSLQDTTDGRGSGEMCAGRASGDSWPPEGGASQVSALPGLHVQYPGPRARSPHAYQWLEGIESGVEISAFDVECADGEGFGAGPASSAFVVITFDPFAVSASERSRAEAQLAGLLNSLRYAD
ncbi:hypothetical protein [Galactobacter valiniphilus]|uniref:hypothetical protein n=1 Tax=Galactobacter valiniphilus TaxID=2676122 RepID=UPI003735B141